MMIDIAAAAAGLFLEPAARRDINFAADDRLDPFVACLLIKINRAVKNAVISERERREFQLVCLVHELVQTARPIKERKLRMQMQMNKLSLRHADNLQAEFAAAQATHVHNRNPTQNLPSRTSKCVALPREGPPVLT